MRRLGRLFLLAEVGLALAAGRILSRIPFPVALRLTGLQPQPGGGVIPSSGAGQSDLLWLSSVIRRVSRAVPFRALCLEQAYAAALMLRRRGRAAELHLGVVKVDGRITAHAWSMSGGAVLTGAAEMDGHTPLAAFVRQPRA